MAKLVAGPKVYICDVCVAAARRIMESSADSDDKTAKLFPSDSK